MTWMDPSHERQAEQVVFTCLLVSLPEEQPVMYVGGSLFCADTALARASDQSHKQLHKPSPLLGRTC